MKKMITLVVAIMMALTCTTGAFAVDNSGKGSTHKASQAASKISATELKIVKAYLKSVETFDGKYINQYLYPGVEKYVFDPLDETVTVKVLNPKYSKTKDPELALTRVDFSGLLVVSSEEELALVDLQKGITIKVKGKKTYAFQDVVVRNEPINAIEELDDAVYEDLLTYLTDLYDEDIAFSLLDNYAGSADEEDTGTETEDEGDLGTEDGTI